jgi:hypothetical protein
LSSLVGTGFSFFAKPQTIELSSLTGFASYKLHAHMQIQDILAYWKVLATCCAIGLGALAAHIVRKNYNRLRYALLSEQQKHRLKGLNRQAMAQMMAEEEGKLLRAAEAKRKVSVQLWGQKLNGGVTLSGIIISAYCPTAHHMPWCSCSCACMPSAVACQPVM